MAWFGYKANVQQTDQSLLGILLMMSLIPAVFGLAGRRGDPFLSIG